MDTQIVPTDPATQRHVEYLAGLHPDARDRVMCHEIRAMVRAGFSSDDVGQRVVEIVAEHEAAARR